MSEGNRKMDNVIDVSIPVAQVIDQHPEVLDLLVKLGFKQPHHAQYSWAQGFLETRIKIRRYPHGEDCANARS